MRSHHIRSNEIEFLGSYGSQEARPRREERARKQAGSAAFGTGRTYNWHLVVGVTDFIQPILRQETGSSAMPEHIRKRLEEEIQQLEYELNHELPKELKKAIALGDLSENAEYHMAKQRQEFVRARLGQLKKRMAEFSMVNLANIPKDRVAFGSTVVVYDGAKNEQIEYKLVTSEESDVAKGLISTSSPIGRGLMGKKVGDTATVVTPTGKRELEILKLTTVHDEAV